MATSRKTALVTGANGFIGAAVALAFVRAGYRTYGLIRRESAIPDLFEHEIIPVLGTPDDRSFIPALLEQSPTFDVIASVTEDLDNYVPHFENIVSVLRTLSESSLEHGVKPFVLFTSGCKDYGTTPLHGDPALAPQNEDAGLNPPPRLADRARNATRVFDLVDAFDAVVLRPTTLYGYSSSYYGPAFEAAAKAKMDGSGVWRLPADQNSLMHGTHVDDVAAAYVALAEAPRVKVSGKCYNIASHRYETLEEVAGALAREYGIERVEFDDTESDGDDKGFDPVKFLWGFPQWVGSDGLRKDTGWTDVRPLFCEAVSVYRKAYEEAKMKGHSNVERVKAYATKK